MSITVVYCLLFLVTLGALAFIFMPVIHSQTTSDKRYPTVIIVSLCYIAVSLGIYSWVGAPRIVPLLAQREDRITTLKTEISNSLEKVKTNPNDLQAWVVLGTNFIETGQIDSAVEAFKQTVLLSGGDPVLILAYVKAQIMQASGKVSDEAKHGLRMVLLMQPENPEARYFMAIRNLQDGNMKEAMSEMKSLYHSLPEDSPLKARIDQQIGRK